MIKKPLFSVADDPLVWATKNLIRLKNIRITPGEVEDALLRHPHYPSLAALTEMFSRYKIQTLALRTSSEHLHKMDFPAIAHLVDGNFSILLDVEGDHVVYMDVDGKKRRELLRNFSNHWTGALFMTDAEGGDPLYDLKKRREALSRMKVPLLLLLAMTLVMASCILSQSLLLSVVLMLTLTGAALTVVLGSKAFQEGKFGNSFCRGNAKIDCNAVLNSSAASVWGMPMTNVGFIFFAGSFLALVLGIFAGNISIPLMTLTMLAAVPYAFFSIYYQYSVVRKWCTLCIAVQGIVLLSAVLLVIEYNTSAHSIPDANSILVLFTGFVLTAMYMFFPGEPFQGTAARLRETERKLNVWKSDPEFFRILLQRQKFVDASPFRDEIILGNAAANTTVVMVIDPACKPCEKALKTLMKVYHLVVPHVKLYLRFKFDPNDAMSIYVVDQLLTLGAMADEKMIIEALNDFLSQPFSVWSTKYNDTPNDDVAEQRHRHLDWYTRMRIESTPAFIINGHMLPVHHSVEDLPFVLPELEVVVAETYNQ